MSNDTRYNVILEGGAFDGVETYTNGGEKIIEMRVRHNVSTRHLGYREEILYYEFHRSEKNPTTQEIILYYRIINK